MIIALCFTFMSIPGCSNGAQGLFTHEKIHERAQQGDSDAQFKLGVMYQLGRGEIQSYTEAIKWYYVAAEQGHVGAQYRLGVMYDVGRGVPRDYVQAHKWINLTINYRSIDVFYMLSWYRGDLERKMTREQIATAQKLALEWKPKTWEELKTQLK